MKKLYLTLLICVTVGCVIGGTVMHALRLAVYAGKYINLPGVPGIGSRSVSSDGRTTEDYDLEPFTRLQLDVGAGDIILKQGDGYHLTYTGLTALAPTVDAEGGVTAIHQDNVSWRSLLNNAGKIGQKNTLTITYPSDAKLLELIASLDMGDFTIDGVTAQTADISLSMGNLELRNGVFGNLTVENDMGNVTATDVEAGAADFSDNMGNIEISRLGGFTSLTLDADMGNIDAFLSQNFNDLTLDLNADLGSVYVNGEKSASHTTRGNGALKVTADASMGTIRINTP